MRLLATETSSVSGQCSLVTVRRVFHQEVSNKKLLGREKGGEQLDLKPGLNSGLILVFSLFYFVNIFNYLFSKRLIILERGMCL